MFVLSSEYLYMLSFVFLLLIFLLMGCVCVTYDRLTREYVELRSVD